MTLPEKRRRQILDDDTDEARFDAARDTSALQNGRVQEDNWVSSFMGRLAALVRDVGGREK